MRLTIYNVVASICWCDICILLFCFLRRRQAFLRAFGVTSLLIILLVGLIRFFVPIEFPFTTIVRSKTILPAIQAALRNSCVCSISYGHLILVIWGIVSLILIIRIFYAAVLQKRKISSLVHFDNTNHKDVLFSILPMRIKERADIIVSPDISIPSVVGFFRPIFLLPDMDLTQAELQHILRHEYGHYVGRDAWIKLYIRTFKAVFWWNPLVYMLEKDLDYILEARCDAFATKGYTPNMKLSYVQAVAEVVRQSGKTIGSIPNYALPISGKHGGDELYKRMKLVFDDKPRHSGYSLVIIVFMAAFIIVSYSFVLQPASLPPEESDYIIVDPNNSYVIMRKDGSYDLYFDGQYLHTLTEEEVSYLSGSYLEIRKEG